MAEKSLQLGRNCTERQIDQMDPQILREGDGGFEPSPSLEEVKQIQEKITNLKRRGRTDWTS